MDLRALETFQAVVQAGGIGRAAERLHRVQSSVTSRIHQLEASLGVTLFDREGQRLRLTAAGETLVDYARRLLELADETRLALRTDAACGRIRLGAMESSAASRLPQPLARFHRDHPHISVELQTAPSLELLRRLQAGALDLALVGGDYGDSEHYLHIPLYREELVLVGAAHSPLLDEPKRLAGATLLVFQGNDNSCAYRRRLQSWLRSLRVVPARVLEFGSYHAIFAAAASGVGISLVPRSVLAVHPHQSTLSFREMPARVARVRTTLVMPRATHAPALKLLVDCLRADAAAHSKS